MAVLLGQTLAIWKALPLPGHTPEDDATVPAVQAPRPTTDRHDTEDPSTPLVALLHRIAFLAGLGPVDLEAERAAQPRLAPKTHRSRLFEIAEPDHVPTPARMLTATRRQSVAVVPSSTQVLTADEEEAEAEERARLQGMETAGWMSFQPSGGQEPLWAPSPIPPSPISSPKP